MLSKVSFSKFGQNPYEKFGQGIPPGMFFIVVVAKSSSNFKFCHSCKFYFSKLLLTSQINYLDLKMITVITDWSFGMEVKEVWNELIL